MSDHSLLEQVMALPPNERAELAEALWESIGEPTRVADKGEDVDRALRRDAELTSGQVVGRSHDQVMEAARRAIGCD